jgi:hypothetical protein
MIRRQTSPFFSVQRKELLSLRKGVASQTNGFEYILRASCHLRWGIFRSIMYETVDVWVRNWASVQTSNMSGAATQHVRRSLGTHWISSRDIHTDTGALRRLSQHVISRWPLRGFCALHLFYLIKLVAGLLGPCLYPLGYKSPLARCDSY